MKSKSLLGRFSSRGLALLIIILLIRGGEHIAFNLFHKTKVELYHQIVINGLLRDVFMVFHFSLLLLIPYLLLGTISKKLAGLIQMTASSILIITHFLLIKYFFSTLSLLDGVIVSVKWDQLMFIMGSEATWTDWKLLLFFLLMALTIYAFWWLAKRNLYTKVTYYSFYTLLIASTLLFPFNNLEKKFFRDNISHNLTNNKEIFLARDIYNHLEKEARLKVELKNIDWTIKKFQKENTQFEFTSEEYPLMHKNNYKDVLGPYFDFQEQLPNFVFVFSESLSRSFSGPNPRLGSFTPFLDSLAGHSLYFEHFLSNSDRTYGIFTNLLSSLPNANERGLINMGNEMPKVKSFPEILRKNNYTSNVYFGGWGSFDQMGSYFKTPLVDHYFTESDFPPSYKEIRNNSNGMTWAYSDNLLYKRSLELMNEYNIQPPYCNMYITVSLHTPFHLPKSHEGKYDELFLDLSKKYSTSGKAEMDYYTAYDKVFKACLFADDALRQLIYSYKKRKEFDNTIFIIVGDHHSWGLAAKNELSQYYVPLIIYSPLIDKSALISSVSTHRDVAPSLLAMLTNNFEFESPTVLPWLGTGLDTTKTFQSEHINSFSILKGENGFLYKDIYWSESCPPSKILPNMNIEYIINDTIGPFMKKRFDNWHAVSRYTIYTDKITYPN